MLLLYFSGYGFVSEPEDMNIITASGFEDPINLQTELINQVASNCSKLIFTDYISHDSNPSLFSNFFHKSTYTKYSHITEHLIYSTYPDPSYKFVKAFALSFNTALWEALVIGRLQNKVKAFLNQTMNIKQAGDM